MDSADYIVDLEGGVQVLRDRVTQLEEELRKARDEPRIAHERNIEEMSAFFGCRFVRTSGGSRTVPFKRLNGLSKADERVPPVVKHKGVKISRSHPSHEWLRLKRSEVFHSATVAFVLLEYGQPYLHQC